VAAAALGLVAPAVGTLPRASAAAAALQVPTAAADATARSVGAFDVGHMVQQIAVCAEPATEPCTRFRQVQVHLWYPADGVGQFLKAEYSSRLRGDPTLTKLGWAPTWQVESQVAREGAPIYPGGGAFPVIVFSHGNQNDPIDYAYTLELIASAGFVVAAPQHVGNSQDDVRTDYVNTLAAREGLTPPGTSLIPCLDGQPWSPTTPCSNPSVLQSMQNRANDISAVIDALPGWFGDRVDMARVGVMGHSRGTVTALTAAGGSTTWSKAADPRVKAVMGLEIGAQSITSNVNLAKVTVPTLLLSGTLDQTSPTAVSLYAFNHISSTDKNLILIQNAEHRTFDSTYCDQVQAAGANDLAQANPLDLQTVTQIVAPGGGSGLSGNAMEFCNLKTFTKPVDIRPLVTSLTGFDFDTQHVPTTGLETNDVTEQVAGLAAAFFGRTLN
jgi:predicted dienelactone hydrolase